MNEEKEITTMLQTAKVRQAGSTGKSLIITIKSDVVKTLNINKGDLIQAYIKVIQKAQKEQNGIKIRDFRKSRRIEK